MTDTAAYTAVDLSRLPPPAVIEALSYEAIYADLLAAFQAMVPTFDATLASDPAVKLLQVCAYRELLLRARVNDAARAVMPAFALGADLDHLAALFGVVRLLISPADPEDGVAAVYESDADLRVRLTLAPEGYSVAGPEGAYIFHALSADADVLDASAVSPAPGEVLVTVLARSGTGVAGAALVGRVGAYLSADTRRPLTDHVTVQSATIVDFTVQASITTFAGPDASVVLAQARARLDAYLAASRRLGRDIRRAAILGCLYVEGVDNILLTQPAADVVLDRSRAANCTGVVIVNAGVGG